ncbi:hydroxymethylglutaryl-CoA synthase [Candidatus Gottesmanbacteria bacterium]|nr:hydroxymethylglutaryl-CoA synthase [Candidatus Gottesmanbacteria bacterium]
MVGILSYGTYIPQYRIALSDIAAAWNKDGSDVTSSLKIAEKAIAGGDEDAVTIALEAALRALAGAHGKPSDIDVLFVGSESHPYAVNPTSTIVGELLGVGKNYLAADFEFACKAGTAALQAIAGLVGSGQAKMGLAIGADTAQSRPHDVLEYSSAAAGAAYIIGREKDGANLLATLSACTSYSSDTPDFWRRDGVRYPSHAGRFTGEPAYFTHVMGAAHRLFEKAQCKPSDMDYCVFHMPNGRFPRDVAKRLGFTEAQLAPSLIVDHIGNPYSASSLVGLAAVLDEARPGQRIFMVSYGSGAGSDGFIWETTEELVKRQKAKVKSKDTVHDQIKHKSYIDYVQYLKQTHKI